MIARRPGMIAESEGVIFHLGMGMSGDLDFSVDIDGPSLDPIARTKPWTEALEDLDNIGALTVLEYLQRSTDPREDGTNWTVDGGGYVFSVTPTSRIESSPTENPIQQLFVSNVIEVFNEAGPVDPGGLEVVEALTRDNAEDHARLTRTVEPLFQAFLSAHQSGTWSSDPELNLQYQHDLEALRREIYETRAPRLRLVYEYASVAARALAAQETDPFSQDVALTVVQQPDSGPLDPAQATEIRDQLAGLIPEDAVPVGVDSREFVDRALGWRRHIDVGSVGTSATLGSIVGTIAAAGVSTLGATILGAMVGLLSLIVVTTNRHVASEPKANDL